MNPDRQRELDRLLDGDLPDAERARLQAQLEADPEALEWFADRALLHAQLRRSMQRRGITKEALAATETSDSPRKRVPWIPLVMVAGFAALCALLLWPSDSRQPAFATMVETKSAYWESGDLPTAKGSRLGAGALHLAQGLATVSFDSGAEVILEAPASLMLVDAMNCTLAYGTAVSDIPPAAIGFRILTPSAEVVDHGTRFAVSVFEGTGETHTYVMEGRVTVEDTATRKRIELTTGQRNTVKGHSMRAVTASAEGEVRTARPALMKTGPAWTRLEPVKDATTGFVENHTSEVLLLVKKSTGEIPASRQAYLGFDLSGLDAKRIREATLHLQFAPTGWGLASNVPDATFAVFGMRGEVPDWDESISHGRFPDGEPTLVRLGSFDIPQGVQRGRFGIRTKALADFLRGQTGEVSIKVVRDTVEAEAGGLVHGFASRRHPFLPAPTLSVRFGEANAN